MQRFQLQQIGKIKSQFQSSSLLSRRFVLSRWKPAYDPSILNGWVSVSVIVWKCSQILVVVLFITMDLIRQALMKMGKAFLSILSKLDDKMIWKRRTIFSQRFETDKFLPFCIDLLLVQYRHWFLCIGMHYKSLLYSCYKHSGLKVVWFSCFGDVHLFYFSS